MNDKELHYLSYDPDAIWEEMMLCYAQAGGTLVYPGDEKEMLLRGVQAMLVQVFAAVDNALRMQTLRYAVGEYLDIIGEQRGCERIQAAAARASVTITTNAMDRALTLEAGTAMSADGEVFYLLEEALPLSRYAQSYTVTVRAEQTGSRGNGLLAGTQLQLAVSNEAVRSIVAQTDAAGGGDEENDESYRERIRLYEDETVTTGPKSRYEAAAKAVSTEIIDAAAVNGGAGRVELYLILADEAAAAPILQAVTEALSADDVRPLTDTVSVQVAEALPYVLNVEYTAESGVASSALQEAVSEYQQWQDETVGQSFDPYRLMALLYQAGATLVQWGAGSSFNGGAVERTAIPETKRCSGTVTLTDVSA